MFLIQVYLNEKDVMVYMNKVRVHVGLLTPNILVFSEILPLVVGPDKFDDGSKNLFEVFGRLLHS